MPSPHPVEADTKVKLGTFRYKSGDFSMQPVPRIPEDGELTPDPFQGYYVEDLQKCYDLLREGGGVNLSALGDLPHYLPENWRELPYKILIYIAETQFIAFPLLVVEVDEGIPLPMLSLGILRTVTGAQNLLSPFPTELKFTLRGALEDRPIPEVFHPPVVEWHRPNLEALDLKTVDARTVAFLQKGGMFLRKRTEATPVEFP